MPRNRRSERVKLRISLFKESGTTAEPVQDLLLDYNGHHGYNAHHYIQMSNARFGKAETIIIDRPKTPESTAFRIRAPLVKILGLTSSSQVYSIICAGKSEDVIMLTELIGLPDAKSTPLPEKDKYLIEICNEYDYSHWFASIRIKTLDAVAKGNMTSFAAARNINSGGLQYGGQTIFFGTFGDLGRGGDSREL